MAEAILRDQIQKVGKETAFCTASAGIYAMPGDAISDYAAWALRQMGIDVPSNGAQRVTEELLQEAHVVLTMERRHAQVLCEMFPQYADKIIPICRWAGAAQWQDVPDPYGAGQAVYLNTAEKIQKLAEQCLHRLLKEETEK